MAELTMDGAELPDGQRRLLLAQTRWVARQMQEFAFGRTCCRDALMGYFGEARAIPRHPLALRVVDWMFAKRQASAEAGVCCDVCHAGQCPPASHCRFVCDALGIRQPAS